MTSAVALPAAAAAAGAPWRRHAVALALVVAALLLLFRADAAALVDLWWTGTAWGHCLLIGPIVGWLVWQRRRELAALEPVAWVPGLALVAAGGLAWLLGAAGEVSFARQLGLLAMVEGAVVALLGPQVARGLAYPLAYAWFMVPLGDWLEPPLQTLTARLAVPLLHLAGVPATIDGVLVLAGPYRFEVAEACSGARFVVAMIALATLVAATCFTRWRRRLAFMAAAVVVPILANAVRAAATIYAAQLFSIEAASGFDHIVYGWLFFGIVIALVMGIGWRWFDRAPDARAVGPAALGPAPRRRPSLVAAALLVVAVAALFPAWSGTTARSDPLPDRIELPVVPGWHRVPLGRRAPWRPYYPDADHYLIGRYADAQGRTVDVAAAVYASQAGGRSLVRDGVGLVRDDAPWVRVADLPPIAGGRAVRLVAPGPVERVAASWYRVGTMLTGSAEAVKLETMRTRLAGGPQRAVAVHLSAERGPGQQPATAIARFAAAWGPLDRAADRLAGAR